MYLSRNEIPEGWSLADGTGYSCVLKRFYDSGLPEGYSLRGQIELNYTYDSHRVLVILSGPEGELLRAAGYWFGCNVRKELRNMVKQVNEIVRLAQEYARLTKGADHVPES